MCRRNPVRDRTGESRNPGQSSSSRSSASSTGLRRFEAARKPREERLQRRRQIELGHGSVDGRDLDRRDARQVARDLAPALALVGARDRSCCSFRSRRPAPRACRSPCLRAGHRRARPAAGARRRAAARSSPRRAVGQTAALPSGMQRPWPGSSGITSNVSRSCGCAPAANPNSVGSPSEISESRSRRRHRSDACRHGSAGRAGRCRPATSRACGRGRRPPGSPAASRRASPCCGASTRLPSSVVSKMPIPWTIAQ